MNRGSLDSHSSPMPMVRSSPCLQLSHAGWIQGGLLRHGAAGQSEAVRAEMNQLVGNQARLPEFRRGGHKQNHGQRKATLDDIVLPSIDLESENAVPTSPSRKRNKNKSPSSARNETQSNNLSSPSSKKAKVRSASPNQKGSAAAGACHGPDRVNCLIF